MACSAAQQRTPVHSGSVIAATVGVSSRKIVSATILVVLLFIGARIVQTGGYFVRLGARPASLAAPFTTEEAWVIDEIVRCAATNVDPVTAERDMEIPKTLMRHFDHNFCGIYAEVIAGGQIAPGDNIEIVG